MVLLLTDVFLLLTQILLWIVVGLVIWFFLSKVLDKKFLGVLVLLLLLAVIVMAFFQGGISDPSSILSVLWRLISFPLTPLGLGIILLLLLFTNPKLAKGLVRKLILGALILLALGSIPVVAYFLAQELEMEAIELITPVTQLDAGGRQVIVLLGQNTTRTQLRPRVNPVPVEGQPVERAITQNQFDVLSTLPIQMTAHGNRIVYAAQLYQEETRRGTNPLIIVSANRRGDRRQKDGEVRETITEAAYIQQMLTQTFNVPEGAILLDHENGNMRNSAIKVRELLQNQQINFGNQIMLVASAINMNRAALTFREVFNASRIIARPTDFYTLPRADRLSAVASGRDLVEREILITDVLPTAEAFWLSSQAIQEYLNSFFYFLRGWIRPFQAPNLIRPPTSVPAPRSPEGDLQPRSLPTAAPAPEPTFTPSPATTLPPQPPIAPVPTPLPQTSP